MTLADEAGAETWHRVTWIVSDRDAINGHLSKHYVCTCGEAEPVEIHPRPLVENDAHSNTTFKAFWWGDQDVGILDAIVNAHNATTLQATLDGAALIAAERQRQIEAEGWTPEHDRIEHGGWELVYAAAAYLLHKSGCQANPTVFEAPAVPICWPWEDRFWKPTPDDRIRELTKAGALIAAEIDRLSND